MEKAVSPDGPTMTTGMLIRRPPDVVFEAFVDPEVTTRFWFTRSSGRLVPGRRVYWEWEMHGVGAPVNVLAAEPHERLVIEWGGEGEETIVEWRFRPLQDGSTYVEIENRGFRSVGDRLVQEVGDAMQGFTLVLAGLKALLEHDIELNLIGDRHPRQPPLKR